MRYLVKISEFINNSFAWIAVISLIATMLLIVVNMFLRAFFVSITGTVEIVGWLTAITTAFALGYTQMRRGHISIDILLSRLNPGVQFVISSINYFMATVIFLLISWLLFLLANRMQELGSLSETIRVAYYPFIFAVALGCVSVALTFFVDFSKLFSKTFNASQKNIQQ